MLRVQTTIHSVTFQDAPKRSENFNQSLAGSLHDTAAGDAVVVLYSLHGLPSTIHEWFLSSTWVDIVYELADVRRTILHTWTVINWR